MTKVVIRTLLAATALAFGSLASAEPVPPHGNTIVSTRHSAVVRGVKIAYTARAGLLPLYVNDTGERMGSVFFIAYIADRPPGAKPRPLTFLWNGGPGSNSAQVNVVGFGPKRVQTPDTLLDYADISRAPLVDHGESWLDTSDLVFIDPPGTGFSRATTEAFRDILYTGRGDAEAVSEAIRLFLTRYDMWDRPLFIGGESYGTLRAMLVAEMLERRRTRLQGVVLISGPYEAGQNVPAPLAKALQITLFTNAAYFHNRLGPELQVLPREEAVARAEQWARTAYAPALGRIAALTDGERDAILAGLKSYTGLDPKYIDRKTLEIPPDVFDDKLLADQGLELGRYDRRMAVKYRGDSVFWMPWDDPSLAPMRDLMEGTSPSFNAYVRKDLGFESDLLYRGPFGKAFHPEPLTIVDPKTGFASDWMSSMWNYGQYVTPNGKPLSPMAAAAVAAAQPAVPPLLAAMTMDPKLMVMNLMGRFDGSCSKLNEEVARSGPAVSRRVVNHCVEGGHMFYSDKATRAEVQRDFAAFVAQALAN
jgi:carboxypeptidase C (cathepsin A)